MPRGVRGGCRVNGLIARVCWLAPVACVPGAHAMPVRRTGTTASSRGGGRRCRTHGGGGMGLPWSAVATRMGRAALAGASPARTDVCPARAVACPALWDAPWRGCGPIEAVRLPHVVAFDEPDRVREGEGQIVALEGNGLYVAKRNRRNRSVFRCNGLAGFCRIWQACRHPDALCACGPVGPWWGVEPVKVHVCSSSPCRSTFDGLHSPVPRLHLAAIGWAGLKQSIGLEALWEGVASAAAVSRACGLAHRPATLFALANSW